MGLNVSLPTIPMFEGLSNTELESITPYFLERSYKRGTIICLEGDEGDEMYVIKKGAVKVYRALEEKEVILAFLQEGDCFGEMALMDETQTRSATVETLEATILYVLKRQDYLNFLHNHPQMAVRLLQLTMARLRKANERIQNFNLLNARTRIIKTILQLASEYGVPKGQEMIIDFKLTHQQLADLTGFVRETVSAILTELREEGLIEIEQRKIRIMNLAQLEEQVAY
ncbi:Crp/Fnr family transcriptional regulator [Ammoniphilus resinae]|uniref:CRP/FNR family transcriptional regulator n=1 Tax=Ammoniphilus resinae TaxID=861532 RepID=A0ABS4GPT8_9BACL|nr:Crp/Fnr family transcriptional regulator [Ammoniphilus resinae]MBP1932284.1 CRP/FNR family transcriptional regulator [Ammoniphilus resinae]